MKDNDIIPAHSPIGASNFERVYQCPGSVALIPQAPEAKTSIYAAEGTAAHLMASEHLTCKLKEAVIGKTKVFDGHEITFTDEMREAVSQYVEFIRDKIRQYQLLPSQYWVEQRVEIPGVEDGYGDYALFGTADFIGYVPYDRLIVADYKHGAGVRVNPRGNKQLLYYGLGALLSLPISDYEKGELTTAELIIAQPRIPGGGISSVEIPIEDLYTFWDDLKKAVARVKPGAPLNAGSWCKWCPAKIICPAFKNQIQIDVGLDFADVQLPAVVKHGLPQPAALPLDEIRRILNSKEDIIDYLNAIEGYAFSLLEANPALGAEIGRKIVPKRSNRAYKDPLDAEFVLSGVLGEKAYKKTLLTPAQAEKVLTVTEKKECKFDDLVHKPDNGYTMVALTDERPSKQINAVDDFVDLAV